MEVKLISYTHNPIESICTAISIMKDRDPLTYVLSQPYGEKLQMIDEILKTRLRGALEFATFEFLIEGVTRAFTHQLVRHRTFHFSQQSMRFFNASSSGFRSPNLPTEFKSVIDSQAASSFRTYNELVEKGCPTQDARSILPTNVLTKIMFGCTFRGLLDLAEVRMCLQTQDEFRDVMEKIKKEVSRVEPFLGAKLVATCDRSGHCEFQSIYDRKCAKRGGESGGSNQA